MMRIVSVIVFLAVSSLHASAEEKNDISVALIHVPGILEPDATDSPYNRLVQRLSEKSSHKLLLDFYPFSRADRLMRNDQINCLFPAVRGESDPAFPTVNSATVNLVSVHLFSLQEEYQSFSDIPEKTVIYLKGYTFGHWRLRGKDEVVWVPVRTQKSALDILQSGRAAAYIDYLPDIKMSLSQEAFSRLKYAKAHPIQKFEDVVECVDTQKNRAFLHWLNQEIEALKKTGELHRLLGNYYNF